MQFLPTGSQDCVHVRNLVCLCLPKNPPSILTPCSFPSCIPLGILRPATIFIILQQVALYHNTAASYTRYAMHLLLLSTCLLFRQVTSLTFTLTVARRTSARQSRKNSFLSSSSSSSWSSLDAIPDRQLVFQGMEAFRQGNIPESIVKFDASVPLGSKAYLWQRGISYYYNDQFALGSQQFKDDVLRSPLDVEEIVWDIACLLRMDNSKFPPPDMMSLPLGMKDRRPIMVLFSEAGRTLVSLCCCNRNCPSNSLFGLLL
jgi:hypothetical protein